MKLSSYKILSLKINFKFVNSYLLLKNLKMQTKKFEDSS